MNTNLAYANPAATATQTAPNLIIVDFNQTADTKPARRSTSLYTSRGIPKATAADPIRSTDDIYAMQNYYLSRGQVRNYTIFTIGILFGLRANDLLSLKIHHVINPNGTFKSHCDLIESKTRKFNNPAITPQIRQVLNNYLATRKNGYSLNGPLFISRNCDRKTGAPKPITIQMLNHLIKEAAAACSVPGHISSHSLRKTFAYHMIKSNPNSDTAKFAVQKMLNHADFKTTLTYCGITQEEVDGFRAGLSAVFAPPAE